MSSKSPHVQNGSPSFIPLTYAAEMFCWSRYLMTCDIHPYNSRTPSSLATNHRSSFDFLSMTAPVWASVVAPGIGSVRPASTWGCISLDLNGDLRDNMVIGKKCPHFRLGIYPFRAGISCYRPTPTSLSRKLRLKGWCRATYDKSRTFVSSRSGIEGS